MFFTETYRKILASVEERVARLERTRDYVSISPSLNVSQIERNFNALADRIAFLEAENERLTKKRKPCSTCGHREKVR